MDIIELILLAKDLFYLLPWHKIGSFKGIKDSIPSPSESLCKNKIYPSLSAQFPTQKSLSFRKNLCRSFFIIYGMLPVFQNPKESPPEYESSAPETPKAPEKINFSDGKEREEGPRQEQIETQDSSVKFLSDEIADVEKSEEEEEAEETEGISLYNGLPNFGNTCFANSLVQSLYHTESFREGVIEAYHDRSHVNNLLDLLAELFIAMKSGSNNRGYLYRRFLDKMFKIRNEFKIGIQGDSSALFRALVEELCEKRDIKEIPYLKIFTGEDLITIKRCPKCGADREVKENIRPLEAMDINFLKDKSRQFFKMSTELRRCTRCNFRGELECRYSLAECPEILAIRIQDTKGSSDTVRIIESFVLFEGVEKRVEYQYKFVAGVLNTAKGERGHHSVEISQIHGRWYQISDESCREISYERLNFHPKILFYQRHGNPSC